MALAKLSLDVGCGFLRKHTKRGMVGIDLRRGLCDVVADAEYLPFREDVFNRVYLLSILEHLDNPIKCLKESLRVAKDGARFQIIIPVDASYAHLFFKKAVLEFPFGMLTALLMCMSVRKYGKLKGHLHVSLIQPRHIVPFFSKAIVRKKREIHSWFSGRKGRTLNKVFCNRKIYGNVYHWVIEAKKDTAVNLTEQGPMMTSM